jgi:outer membrane protein assembly factor BamB
MAGMGDTAGAPAVSGDLPCAVADFLSTNCVMCHGTIPRLGAPISLVKAAEFQVQRSGMTVAALAALRVQNAMRPMPPAMLLPAATVTPFVTWLNAGAMPMANGCGVREPSAEEPGAAGSGGGISLPAAGGGAVDRVGTDWPMFGGDLANTRNNPNETAITPANVGMLKPLWTWKGAGTTGTPVVAGGVVYVPTWDGKVHALDAASGMEKWSSALPDLIDSTLAITDTQIFASDDNGSVHSLDRMTGEVQWSKVVDMHAEAHLWSSPIFVPGLNLVVVGIASGEEQVPANPPYSFKGSVVALDAMTGTEKWRFQTTNADASGGPGVGVWATPVIDMARKLAFVGTGNAYSGMAGQYTDSMLALRLETGELAWSHQFTKGDVFSIYGGSTGPDFDIGATANLFEIGGKDVIGIAIKSGDYALLERETGTVLWTTHIGDGSSMGGMIASAAVANGRAFVASNSFPGNGTTVASIDLMTGMVGWKNTITGALAYGGLLHTNGVVFAGLNNGAVMAWDAMSGKELWKTMASDAIGGGPSLSHGVLYVPWGYTWTLREGEAGNGGVTAYGLK